MLLLHDRSNGQILPRILTDKGDTDWERQKKLITIQDYRHPSAELSNGQQMVLATIDTLNLNSPSLISQREKYVKKLLLELKNMSHADLGEMYDNANKRQKNNQWERFVGIKLYLLEWQLYFHKKDK